MHIFTYNHNFRQYNSIYSLRSYNYYYRNKPPRQFDSRRYLSAIIRIIEPARNYMIAGRIRAVEMYLKLRKRIIA